MVLLGSIQRTELIEAIKRQISNQKRLAAVRLKFETQRRKIILDRQRQLLERRALEEELLAKEAARKELEELARKMKKEKESQEKKKEEEDVKMLTAYNVSERRPSRFEVTAIEPPKLSDTEAEPAAEDDDEGKAAAEAQDGSFTSSAFPRKSILKKNNSHTIGFSTLPAAGRRLEDFEDPGDGSPGYQTLTGFEHHPRWKNKLQTMFKRPSELSVLRGSGRVGSSSTGSFRAGFLNVPMEDMSVDEVAQWEDEQMKQVSI
jgi:hypothetical protein